MKQLYLVTLHAGSTPWDASPLDDMEDGDWGRCLEFYCIEAETEVKAIEIAIHREAL